MRIEIENNRALRELIDKVEAASEPVELTRGGETVATVAVFPRPNNEITAIRATEAERRAAGKDAMELLKKARANAKKSHNLTERQLMSEINKTIREVRKKHAQSGR